MIDLEVCEFAMQYGSGVAESLDAAGIDCSVTACIQSSSGPGDADIASWAGATRDDAP